MPDRHAAAREYVERHTEDLAAYREWQSNPPAAIGSRSIDLGLLAVLAALLADADELVRLRGEVADLRETLEHIAAAGLVPGLRLTTDDRGYLVVVRNKGKRSMYQREAAIEEPAE